MEVYTNGPLASRMTTTTTKDGGSSSSTSGSLTVEVLSAYDLPYSEAPMYVSVTVNGNDNALTQNTGPPLARHKNRNSFRFSSPGVSSPTATTTTTMTTTTTTPSSPSSSTSASSSTSTTSSSSIVNLMAPLRTLYHSTVKVRVMYANEKPPLETTYDLHQLRIHESKWLILNLHISESSATTSTSTTYMDDIPPTIRVKLTLKGPYRPEIKALLDGSQAWFNFMDRMEQKFQSLASSSSSSSPQGMISNSRAQLLALPFIPLVTGLVVGGPILIGLAMICLPFLLPILVSCIGIIAVGIVSCGGLYFSTRVGRDHLGGILCPLGEQFVSSRAGQTLCYDTGPRPTPVSVAKLFVPSSDQIWGRLFFSLLIDLIGSSSYLLPIVGEVFDFAWAPTQTILIMAMYETSTPNLKYISFLEEILPFTDIVPSATIGFLAEIIPKVLNQHHPEVAKMVDTLIIGGGTNTATGTITTTTTATTTASRTTTTTTPRTIFPTTYYKQD